MNRRGFFGVLLGAAIRPPLQPFVIKLDMANSFDATAFIELTKHVKRNTANVHTALRSALGARTKPLHFQIER